MSNTLNQTYPDDLDGEILQMLADDGHDMNIPTWVDFHVAAPTEDAAKEIAAAAEKLGYETVVEFDDGEGDEEEGENTEPWTCTCGKEIPLQHAGIIGAQAELDEIARPLGGYSDGWGSFGNLEPEAE